jgi:Ribonuclease G/E
MKARIRGIYSTALARLLLDNDFSIAEPSIAAEERFKLNDNNQAPDISIEDRYDRHGIRTSGDREATERLSYILQSNLDDVIVRKWPISVGGIYKGLLRGVDISSRSILIDIGEAVGRIPEEEKDKIKSKEVLVQVRPGRIGAREPSLTTKIAIPGRYAILTSKCKVGISLKIQDPEVRARLHELGKNLCPKDWGIIWRTEAANRTSDNLKNEVENLTREAQNVLQKAEQAEAPIILREGSYVMDIELPALSKKRLDEIRAMTRPTLAGHHYFKVVGGRVAAALEAAESSLEKGEVRKEVEAAFRQEIEAEYPFAGANIGIEHVKPSGIVLYLGKATIESLDETSIRLRRVFAKDGVYDGLGAQKEAGDVALTEASLGEWYFQTKYYSKDGRYKGCYVNFNTPVELYPHCIRYVDLEVDICLLPDGTLRTVDEEKLENAVSKGFVSERLAKMVQQRIQRVKKRLRNCKDL